MKKTPRILVSLAAVTVLFSIASPLYAAGGGIGGRPANPDSSNPRTQSIFIYDLSTGASKDDAVLIMNTTSQAQVVELYAVDGILTNTGAYACKQEVEQKSDVGAWVSFSQKQVTLAANSSQKVPFSLKVPGNADAGEHNGCLVFQSASDEGEVQGNVRVRTRQAIRMAVTLPGDLKKEITIKNFDVDRINGVQQFLLSVANKGNVSADVDVDVSLSTLWGSRTYQNSGGYPVLADTSLDLNYVNEHAPFWGGWYKATARVSYDTRPGVYNVTDNEYKKTVEASPITVFIIPHPVAFALYWSVVIIGAIALFFKIRRMRESKEIAQWVEYKTLKGDTISDLALQRGIDWRLVARVNKIKKPYTLTRGDAVKLPPLPEPVAKPKTAKPRTKRSTKKA